MLVKSKIELDLKSLTLTIFMGINRSKFKFSHIFKKSKKKEQQKEFSQFIIGAIPEIRPIKIKIIKRNPSVCLLLPTLNSTKIYGGAATAIIFASKLSLFLNKELKIIQTLSEGDASQLFVFFQENQIAITESQVEIIDISNRNYKNQISLHMAQEDLFIASAWGDAMLAGNLPVKEFIYLIQDFEPIFYPNSDRGILAENTYRIKNFIPVCNTRLMYEFLKQKGYQRIGEEGLWFEPAVSRINSGMSRKNSSKKIIFIYGRPSVPRNLFYSALMAINKIIEEKILDAANCEIFMAGENDIPSIKMPQGIIIENKGKMDMQEYINFSKTIDLAISLMMSPHPNYPTLEFASIGAAVVTTCYETKKSLTHYSKNILLSNLEIDSLVTAIKKGISMDYDERIKNLETNNIQDNWDESFKEVFLKLRDRIKE